jgi:hypothetical protein
MNSYCKCAKNRHLDEGFLTWNGSETQLRSLFDMSTNVHHHAMRINATIESTVHFVDACLSHDHGELTTTVYHHPNTHNNTLPDVPHVPMCPNSHLLRAALIRAARCCSNLREYNDEQSRIQLSYHVEGFAHAFVEEFLQRFLVEFGSSSMVGPISDPADYNSFRRRIIDFEQRKAELKAQRTISRKHKLTFHYPIDWDVTKVSKLQHILEAIFRKDDEQSTGQPKQEFEMIPARAQDLSANDFLVDKRPPIRLLTLAQRDQIDTSKYQMISVP